MEINYTLVSDHRAFILTLIFAFLIAMFGSAFIDTFGLFLFFSITYIRDPHTNKTFTLEEYEQEKIRRKSMMKEEYLKSL